MRMTPEFALEHPKRNHLHQLVVEDPGISFRSLVRLSGIPSGTVRHHLTKLVRARVLIERQFRHSCRFFDRAFAQDTQWTARVLLREPELLRLAQWVERNPGLCQREVLDHFDSSGTSRSTCQHRLSRLVENGILRISLQGRRMLYDLAARLPSDFASCTEAVPVPIASA